MKGALEILNTKPKKIFALISVEFPKGSTCTCSNGSKSFRARSTDGQWIFAIPEPHTLPETWTITATDGKNKKSKQVQITEKGQCREVRIQYVFSLFSEGEGVLANYTVKFGEPVSAGPSVSPEGIVWANTNGVGNQVWFSPKVDVSTYAVLCMEFRCDTRNGNSDRYSVSIGVGIYEPTGAAQPNDWKASTAGIWDTKRNIHRVDISSVTGEVYVKLSAYATTGTIFNVWLEE